MILDFGGSVFDWLPLVRARCARRILDARLVMLGFGLATAGICSLRS
ncbi:MAG: hypothetical protein ACI81P_001451 [Neolewinella sp.]|jgi:hypothetical protein